MSLSAEQTTKLSLISREHEVLVACMIIVIKRFFFFVIGYRHLSSTATVLRLKPLVFGFLCRGCVLVSFLLIILFPIFVQSNVSLNGLRSEQSSCVYWPFAFIGIWISFRLVRFILQTQMQFIQHLFIQSGNNSGLTSRV